MKVFILLLFCSSSAMAQSFVPKDLDKLGVKNNPAIECFNNHGLYVKDLDYNLEKLNLCILQKANKISKQNLTGLGESVVETATEGQKKAKSLWDCVIEESSWSRKAQCFLPQFLK